MNKTSMLKTTSINTPRRGGDGRRGRGLGAGGWGKTDCKLHNATCKMRNAGRRSLPAFRLVCLSTLDCRPATDSSIVASVCKKPFRHPLFRGWMTFFNRRLV
jgi:hypothetical protein